MKNINKEWATLAFIAVILAIVSSQLLWTTIPIQSDVDVPRHENPEIAAAVNSMLGVYDTSNFGWLGSSVATGIPLWVLVLCLVVVGSYACIAICLHKVFLRSIVLVAALLVLAVIIGDTIAVKSKGGEVDLGLYAAALASVGLIVVSLCGPRSTKTNQTEQVAASDR